MITKYVLLALSASIDALGLGITYGIKKTKMTKTANIIIFIIIFCCSTIAILLGHYLSILFSPILSILISSSLLILLGLYNIYKGLKKTNTFINFDFDNSNYIDNKESIALAFAVAVDASCVSISAGINGYLSFLLPIFMAIFHTFFVNCGDFLAKNAIQKLKVPSNILSIFSGVLLIFIGIFRNML